MDKYAGGIVGMRGASSSMLSAEDAARTASVSDVLVAGSVLLEAHILSSGELSWRPVADAGEALRCTVARSQMASMLRDASRVAQWGAAVAGAVGAASRALGRAPRVLDVGAGTGLLSLLAARAGAARVDAVEQWPAMAAIAVGVVGAAPPEVAARVHVHAAHSCDMRVEGGAGGGGAPLLPERADVVVSEILDSGLLGEGVLPALRHAYAHLLLAGSGTACVPERATVFAQLGWSPHAARVQGAGDAGWCALRPRQAGCSGGSGGGGGCAGGGGGCAGGGAASADAGGGCGCGSGSGVGASLARRDWAPACEAHAAALPLSPHALLREWLPVSASFAALEINLTPDGVAAADAAAAAECGGDSDAPRITQRVLRVAALEAPPSQQQPQQQQQLPPCCNAVLWWWRATLFTPPGGGPPITYSSSPDAAATGEHQWQDHWVPCLQPLASPQPLGRAYTVVASHTDFLVSFACSSADPAPQVWPSKRAHALARRAAAAAVAAAAAPPAAAPPAAAVGALAAAALYTEPQPCVCGLHRLASSDRRWALSEQGDGALVPAYRAAVDATLAALVAAHTARSPALGAAAHPIRILDLGEGSLAALLAASSPHAAGLVAFVLDHGAALSEHVRCLASEHAAAAAAAAAAAVGEGDAAPCTAPCLLVLPVTAAHDVSRGVLAAAEAGAADADSEGSSSSSSSSSAAAMDDDESQSCEGGASRGALPGGGAAAVPMAHGDGVEHGGSAVAHGDDAGPLLDALLCEPHWAQTEAAPLWAASLLWHRIAALVANGVLAPGARVLPARVHVVVQAVRIPDLAAHSIGAVGDVAGFSHAPFQDAVGERLADAGAVPLPLWQYRVEAASAATRVLTVDLASPPPRAGAPWAAAATQLRQPCPLPAPSERRALPRDAPVRCGAECVLRTSGAADAVVCWAEWELTLGGPCVATGWRGGAPGPHRQAVHWLRGGRTAPAAAVAVGVHLDEDRGVLTCTAVPLAAALS